VKQTTWEEVITKVVGCMCQVTTPDNFRRGTIRLAQKVDGIIIINHAVFGGPINGNTLSVKDDVVPYTDERGNITFTTSHGEVTITS